MLAIKKHKTTLTLAAIFSSALLLIVAALYFEHVEGLLPCIQCVYQRLGVTFIMLSALLGVIFRQRCMKIISLAGVAVGTCYTASKAYEHIMIANNSNPFTSSCEFEPTFPFSLPLDTWLPWLFEANGPCDVAAEWSLMGMSMPEWVFVYSVSCGFLCMAGALTLIKR